MLDDVLNKVFVFILFMFLCLIMPYAYSPYNPNKPNAKYVTIKNKTLAKLLISKRNPWSNKYIKVNDRCKLYFPSFIVYIILVILVIAAVMFQFVPLIPCEPFEFYVGRRGAHFTLYTLNEKVPFISVALIFFLELIYVLIPLVIKIFKREEPKMKLSAAIIILFTLALFISGVVYMLINLI